MQHVSVRKPGPPRVLFVFTPLAMGADVWVQLLLARSLVPLGAEVCAVVSPLGEAGQANPIYTALRAMEGVRVLPLGFGRPLDGLSRFEILRAAPQLGLGLANLAVAAAWARRNRIDVIHSTDRPRDAVANVLIARMSGAESLVHVHVEFASWVGRPVRWAFKRANALVGVSEFVARSLTDGGFARHKVHAILNAIDLSAWDPELDGARARAELGGGASRMIILCVARIYGAKGQEQLIRALPLLVTEFPDVMAVFVGEDYPPGSGHSATLARIAAELGVSAHVLFIGARKDVAELMAAADVFAMPGSGEPFGLVYTEAMAMGKCIVSTADGGTTEVVQHGKSGLLSRFNDIEALAGNLRTVLRDPELRRRMGQHGREVVRARFGAERQARDMYELYAQLAHSAGN